ncbi:uncharacterized protein TEOVI_000621400 [Trypanosoma equiperdum]|uniref:Uncharacterized protein n=4 Tax=Trypanozoon TaxID=39700 RepID=Q382U8_TRYB2|nr:hypothetical protein, conserved [Trypanosoma brucei gambiense DAL972]XP_829295.1 hypothetical protein, conserved [Trypanosoma brucei brucei TREU927]RHW67521.1 hypothetical protein DPX39_110100700 [Trypanosoma brucei equiperdum]SCU65410.1 hypothetical protein, conserved [Trypanosoma equiperdum]EAN80183.1 hypothetical protein, conserved [Trypanosoma brucei brucei TREU927]CBH18258.1 hypothetical protein, conserved [Trypanosoma brucei gambiense DAL972]|eukprot:XP_011780522.1 hypothetical protein, conserved [Trypanosoma brucei gambiense DAL972]
MVRCQSSHPKAILVQLHVVAPSLQYDYQKGPPPPEEACELDVELLCNDISNKMRLLGGMAIGLPKEGLVVEGSHREESGNGGLYNIVVRLQHASNLSVSALRAACAAVMEGAVTIAGDDRGKQRLAHKQPALKVVPVAVRVVKLDKLQ